jgi:hypothetical protein
LSDHIKLIIGRNQADNAALETCATPADFILKMESFAGPTGLMPGEASEDQIRWGGALCARYGDCPQHTPVTVLVRSAQGTRRVEVMPLSPDEANRQMI